ncbi:MAG: TIGR03745 family integrating conjugative element membrane protein [gamma proteobacterium symbiont of Lucinoma myriamae]|nr:TIGR03745 family integrating conjugative element membrane protein [gamma proteobacterium symbiont of Lucinoma myriamae]MCU7817779.1 TIGR03745 family integrating conjugative element membrane protein [gamma proteobacterium symbiont of Lucinoma myriamae]MCU7833368.1 TIGR03745 family integrating conjugative element membrane protein [gamma proteobacterium symbiont of Lucinoma myriamae]
MKKQKGILSRFNQLILLLMSGLTLIPAHVMAAMPTAVDKGSGAAASGAWLALMTSYLDSGTDVIAWGATILAFIVVAVVVIMKFNDARKGRAEWNEVGLTAGVGVVILLFVVFLATEATKVI